MHAQVGLLHAAPVLAHGDVPVRYDKQADEGDLAGVAADSSCARLKQAEVCYFCGLQSLHSGSRTDFALHLHPGGQAQSVTWPSPCTILPFLHSPQHFFSGCWIAAVCSVYEALTATADE